MNDQCQVNGSNGPEEGRQKRDDNFDHLARIIGLLNVAEDEMKLLRYTVGLETQRAINAALEKVIPLRDGLWKVDKALERGGGV